MHGIGSVDLYFYVVGGGEGLHCSNNLVFIHIDTFLFHFFDFSNVNLAIFNFSTISASSHQLHLCQSCLFYHGHRSLVAL